MFALALIVSLLGLAVVVGLLWLRSPWGNAFVRGQIESRLEEVMAGEVRLESVSGDPLTGLILRDLALIAESGVPLVAAEEVRATYSLQPFLDRKIVVDEVRLVRPKINLVRHPDGRWNFQTMFPPREPAAPAQPRGWGTWIHIRDLQFVDAVVDVRLPEGNWPVLDWEENRFTDLNGRMEIALFSRDEDVKRFVARDLSLETTAPPIGVRRLDGAGIVTPDRVVLEEISFETPGSTIRADGTIKLGERDSFSVDVAAPRLSMEEVSRFFPQVRIGGSGTFEGRLEGPAGDVRVVIDESRVDTGSSELAATGTIEDLDDPRLDLSIDVAPLAPVDVRAYVDAYPVAQPVSGTVRLTGPPRRLSVNADLRSRAGAMTMRGEVDFRGATTGYDLAATSRSLDIGAWIGEPQVDLVLTGRYRMSGSGFGSETLDARVAAELGRSRVYRWEFLSLETRGRLVGRRYVADTLVGRMPQSVIRGRGTFGLASDGVIGADVALASEDLEEVWPALGDWAGRLRADARVEGPYRGFGVQAEVTAGDLELGTVTADSFAGTVRLENVAAAGFAMGASGTFHDLHLAGMIADTVGVDIEHANEEMTIDARFDFRGESSATVLARADFSGPAGVVSLEQLRYSSPEQTWRMVEGGRLRYAEGRIVAEEFRLTQNGQAVRMDGVVDLDGDSDLALVAEDLSLEDVARLVGEPPGDWQGRLTLQGRLRGSRRAPEIDLSGEVSEGTIRGFRFRRIDGEVHYDDRLANVDLSVTTSTEGQAVILTGQVPIDLALVGGVDRLPDRPIDLQIRGRNTDLSLVGAFVPGLRDLAGPVDLRVDISGTTESPRFEGDATVRDGTMTIVATGVRYRNIAGQVRFNNDRIVVEEISGRDRGRGRFRIDGAIDVQVLNLGDLDLEATAENLAVLDQEDRSVQVNADIRLTGTTDLPVFTGRVVVDEAIYQLSERRRKDVIDLEEAMIYVDIPGAGRAPPGPRSPSLWDRARIEVDVVVTDDAILQSDNARIEIAGDLALTKPSGESTPRFSGTLQVRRGFYEQFGRRFTIETGQVFFFGTPELNPGLHIVATRTVENVQGAGDVVIRITLGGTLENPTIDLSSTPAFEKSEIISIALFGTPTPSAGQQREFRETVSGLVTGAAAAPLESALAEELNLDTIEIGTRTEPGGDVARLFRVGKFLSPDVYVTFEQEFGGSEEQSRVALRYQVTEIFTLQVTAGTGQRTGTEQAVNAGVDLFWEFTY